MTSGIKVDVAASGPVFDGRLNQSVADGSVAVEQTLGDMGVNMVREVLSANVVESSGFFESQVQTDRSTVGIAVTAGGVVYGPWLEGVGSRNQKSRFKGYSMFRKTKERLATTAPLVAQDIIDSRVRAATQ